MVLSITLSNFHVFKEETTDEFLLSSCESTSLGLPGTLSQLSRVTIGTKFLKVLHFNLGGQIYLEVK